ncbi:MAG: hypothetical protein AAF415_08660 [Pseudomonadota bacterium]
MRVILHVGPPKTGSSYIQEVLLTNTDLLLTMDWQLPVPGRLADRGDHGDLAYKPQDYLTEGEPGHANLAALRGSQHNLIFSAEGLCYWKLSQFEALADILGADHVDVVFFLRDPFATFYSTWREEVKHGNTRGLPEAFMEHFADPSHSVVINPSLLLRNLAHLPKPFRLTVLPYDQFMARGENIIDHIWYKTMRFTAPYRVARSNVNRSFPIGMSEFLRLLLQEYHARYPATNLVEARIAFHKLYYESRDRKSIGLLPFGDSRNYNQRLNEAIDRVMDRKRTFIMRRDTGVHNFIRRQVHEEFGKFMPEPVSLEEIYAEGDVEFTYFNTEDLWKSRAIRRLLNDMIPAIRAHLTARANTRDVVNG